MREIKFRGQIIITNVWHYGDLFNATSGATIVSNGGSDRLDFRFVKPETIGQYTGLKDKNEKEIYEGDIVECEHQEGLSYVQNYTDTGVVEYGDQGSFIIKCPHKGREKAKDINRRFMFISFKPSRSFKIIGNIHENPELL